jgi:hypothetical protein
MSRSQCQTCWYPLKGLVITNIHVKYQTLSTYHNCHSKDICMVKVFSQQVKYKGQGHKVKSVGTHGKLLSQETLMWNIKVLVPTIQKTKPRLKYSISRSITRDRVTKSMFSYPWKGLLTRNTHVKCQSPSTYHSKDIAKVKFFNK